MIGLIREGWDLFLFDTLVWTGALIALALVLRRPVARHLGSGAAYALWSLPMARLLFPPVTLPAWMKPMAAADTGPADSMMQSADMALMPAADSGFSYAGIVASEAPVQMASPIDFVTPLVAVWLVGAIVFMTRRFWLYGVLRRELLADARPVGEVGAIRLIETPAISGPMAFGVLDKVIALPSGFMTAADRQQRDLAIAHELAHHRGHDILANMLVQPLFAIHWFNPLGWMGWTAMRRDQEAACDARVVASRTRDERAAYAAVIADYARRPQLAPRPALAAPMACPVLGDKSIIHRLRTLPMTDHSRRRQLTARAALAGALLALPATASIAYAHAVAEPLPEAAALPDVAEWVDPVVEAELAPEHDWMAEPDALAVAEPAELASIDKQAFAETLRERAEAGMERAEAAQERAERRRKRIELTQGHVDASYAEGRQQWAEGRIQYARSRQQWADGRVQHAMSHADRAAAKAEASVSHAVSSATHHATASAIAMADSISRSVAENTPKVIESCRFPNQPVTSVTERGRVMMYVCDSAGDRIALKALRETRQSIERNEGLSDEIRAEILRDFDREIADLEASIRS